MKFRLTVPASRTCPECEQYGLEITEDPNTYECQICGSVWTRRKPLNDGTGKMINMPKKLKKLLSSGNGHFMKPEDEEH